MVEAAEWNCNYTEIEDSIVLSILKEDRGPLYPQNTIDKIFPYFFEWRCHYSCLKRLLFLLYCLLVFFWTTFFYVFIYLFFLYRITLGWYSSLKWNYDSFKTILIFLHFRKLFHSYGNIFKYSKIIFHYIPVHLIFILILIFHILP